MFKKKEHGFSLVELSVAAAVAIGLAVVAVAVVSGTATSVSSKGTSAASVETCTISEALAKSGGDEAATDCGAGGSEPAAQPAFSASFNPTENVGTFLLNGVEYDLYNEVGTPWMADDSDPWNGGQLFIFRVQEPAYLNMGYPGYADGFYYVDDSQNGTNTWGEPQGTPQVQADGSVYYFDSNNNFRGAVIYFASSPYQGGQPSANPNG